MCWLQSFAFRADFRKTGARNSRSSGIKCQKSFALFLDRQFAMASTQSILVLAA
jgi:hypothetical protein